MPHLTPQSIVRLHPLSRQIESGIAIVGRGDQFYELPIHGLTFLDWLDEGVSLDTARQRFEARFEPFPEADLLALMHAFAESRLIATVDGVALDEGDGAEAFTPPTPPNLLVRTLFSPPALIVWMALLIPAAALLVTTPALWPRAGDYFWFEYRFVVVLVGMALWLIDMPLHELAHLLACRVKGIAATITWTQRLGVIPMSQVVMHTIWSVPRERRLLPIAAGILYDSLRLSVIVYLLWAQLAGLLALPILLTLFLKFYLLTTVLGLISQFWLFSKMDGYFLLSALLGQRNLQADTYAWLRSLGAPGSTFTPPAGGMRWVYVYAAITLVGGGLFFVQMLAATLPIKIQLISEALVAMTRPGIPTAQFADGVAVLVSQVVDLGLLGYVYWRDRYRTR